MIYCPKAPRMITQFICQKFGQKEGNCQNCQWDGQLNSAPLKTTDLDPPLSEIFSLYYVKIICQQGINCLADLLGITWHELNVKFGENRAARFKNILTDKGITELPPTWPK